MAIHWSFLALGAAGGRQIVMGYLSGAPDAPVGEESRPGRLIP